MNTGSKSNIEVLRKARIETINLEIEEKMREIEELRREILCLRRELKNINGREKRRIRLQAWRLQSQRSTETLLPWVGDVEREVETELKAEEDAFFAREYVIGLTGEWRLL